MSPYLILKTETPVNLNCSFVGGKLIRSYCLKFQLNALYYINSLITGRYHIVLLNYLAFLFYIFYTFQNLKFNILIDKLILL